MGDVFNLGCVSNFNAPQVIEEIDDSVAHLAYEPDSYFKRLICGCATGSQ